MTVKFKMVAASVLQIRFLIFLGLFLVSVECHQKNKKPNVVFVLTDDQDTAMGGQIPITKTTKMVGEQGVIFNNMFVTSPLCCPSRSSIMTGKYVHNHRAINNSVSGNCSSPAWQQNQETKAFATVVKSQGYNTFFAGKYLNQYGLPQTGGVDHIPPGWDWWIGLVGNSKYYNYKLSVNGTLEKHGHDYATDYFTDLIHRKGMEFLDLQNKDSDPFFMMLSTPACHAPFTPAPQYANTFPNMTAPRNGSYNVKAKDKHWLIQQTIVPMPDDTVKNSDEIFRNRWRTLLSVDDMVEDVINTLQKKNILDNTFIFFTGDNGYHLGQFGLPYDKRQLYDFDIRVPLMVRGPGIKPGQKSSEVVLNIDFAPTFADIVGGMSGDMDGISILPYLYPDSNRTKPLRTTFLVEHSGEHQDSVPGCPQFKGQGLDNCDNHCVCEDAKNNTFGCVIQISDGSSFKFCEMQDSQRFNEAYDLSKDPYELSNIAKALEPALFSRLSKQLTFLASCQGQMCSSVPSEKLSYREPQV